MKEILLDPRQLLPHTSNSCIYGVEEDVTDLMIAIEESGWIKPLIVEKNSLRIISGHRRCKAAINLNFDTVPCILEEFESEEIALERLLLENFSREKSIEQKIKEVEALKNIEGWLTTQRKIFSGKTRDILAKAAGLGSGYNYSKALAIVDDLGRDKLPTVAKDYLRYLLNYESVDLAFRTLKAIKENGFDCLIFEYRQPAFHNNELFTGAFGTITAITGKNGMFKVKNNSFLVALKDLKLIPAKQTDPLKPQKEKKINSIERELEKKATSLGLVNSNVQILPSIESYDETEKKEAKQKPTSIQIGDLVYAPFRDLTGTVEKTKNILIGPPNDRKETVMVTVKMDEGGTFDELEEKLSLITVNPANFTPFSFYKNGEYLVMILEADSAKIVVQGIGVGWCVNPDQNKKVFKYSDPEWLDFKLYSFDPALANSLKKNLTYNIGDVLRHSKNGARIFNVIRAIEDSTVFFEGGDSMPLQHLGDPIEMLEYNQITYRVGDHFFVNHGLFPANIPIKKGYLGIIKKIYRHTCECVIRGNIYLLPYSWIERSSDSENVFLNWFDGLKTLLGIPCDVFHSQTNKQVATNFTIKALSATNIYAQVEANNELISKNLYPREFLEFICLPMQDAVKEEQSIVAEEKTCFVFDIFYQDKLLARYDPRTEIATIDEATSVKGTFDQVLLKLHSGYFQDLKNRQWLESVTIKPLLIKL